MDKRRFGGTHWGAGAERKVTSAKYWKEPFKWNKEAIATGTRPRVFCASLADVFDVEAPKGKREDLYKLVKDTPNLDWLFLTKRIENAEEMLPKDWGDGYPNVWMGCTTEDQKSADERIPILGKIPAVVRWLSIEPQIEFIDFSKWMHEDPFFDWMVFGGESGSSRPFDPDWVKPSLEVAGKNGISVFVKQMGSVYAKANRYNSHKGDDIDEWPNWVKVREFPTARATA